MRTSSTRQNGLRRLWGAPRSVIVDLEGNGSRSDSMLSSYEAKRDLPKTPEPGASEVDSELAFSQPIFAIQKHDASKLRYDFRIEVEGVLRSWAVPEGPSTDPSEKRLAIPTEDHSLAYAEFEGAIPQLEYGGGTAWCGIEALSEI